MPSRKIQNTPMQKMAPPPAETGAHLPCLTVFTFLAKLTAKEDFHVEQYNVWPSPG
jgi:hypothetical protein